MAEKKTTKKTTAEVAQCEEIKKAPAKRSCGTKKAALVVNAESVGFKAGDVYQALASSESALSVKEIAKKAKISEEETLLGMGWLFKEGKIVAAEDKITLA
ncbi:MAG: winged helix-turn-helix domain-containing protein [Prevotella sp.]